jgi:hypothetical protein
MRAVHRQGTQAGLFFDAQRRRAITCLRGGAVMSSLTLDVSQWAEQQFGTCELGDKRRTKRLVKLATQVATKPDAATPELTENWADCKAAYRLVGKEKVTFDAVIAPHCVMTRAVEPGTGLVINDTSHLLEQKAGWVIRAAQWKRPVRDDANRECSLEDALLGQAVLGPYKLQVPANDGQPARTALMEIRYARIVMPRPKTGISRYVRDCGVEEIPMVVVETREVNPPRGVTPMRWVLLTSEPVHGFADAWQIIGWYEKRPLVEEYPKCLKTGCSVAARQDRTGDRLAPIIGLLSVVAVRLLPLKMVARQDPDQPAARVVPTNWLAALPLLLKRPKPVVTVRDFFRGLASLGGFLGRKSDGEPGWQTVWSGLETLLQCLRGAEALGKKCG